MGNKCTHSSYKESANTVAIPRGTPLHQGSILGIAVDAEHRVLTCSDDKKIGITSIDYFALGPSINRRTEFLEGHNRAVNRIAVHNNFLWSVSRDLSLRQWDLSTRSIVREISNAHELNLSSVAIHPNGSRVFTGSRDYFVKTWNTETGQKIGEYSTPRNIVTTLSLEKEGNILYQGSEDLCIRAWDTRVSSKSHPAMHIASFVYFPLCTAIHDNGYSLAAGCKGFDGVGCEVKLFDIRKLSCPVSEMHTHRHDVTGCRFSDNIDGGLVSVSKDGSIALWQTNAVSSSTTTVHMTTPQAYEITAGKYYTSLAAAPLQQGSEEVFYVGSFDGCVSKVRMVQKPSSGFSVAVDSVSPPFFTDYEGVTANEEPESADGQCK